MTRSLLPYLKKEGQGIFLELELASEGQEALERLPFPFRLLPSADPLMRIFKGQIKTLDGTAMESVWIISSKDSYRLPPPADGLTTNPLLDDIWTRTLEQLAGQAEGLLLPLPSKMHLERGAGAGPFSPLFFCKRRRIYFEPPCPECGRVLQLCTDDGLLEEAGLTPYSKGLQRYNYCPECVSKGKAPVFYCAGSLAGSQGTAPCRSQDELVMGWAELCDKKVFSSRLPCIECRENVICFGPDRQAASLIAPLSFYPFWAAVIKAPDLSARDFLAALSQAGAHEAKEAGGFLFGPGHDRFALEILYLKAAFACRWLKGFLGTAAGSIRPDPQKVLDRTWIYRPRLPGLLPERWVFSPAYIGLSDDLDSLFSPEGPKNYMLFLAGVSWLQVFCAPEAERTQKFMEAVKLLNQKLAGAGSQDGKQQMPNASDLAALAPEVFRAAAAMPNLTAIPPDLEPFWQEILEAGLNMMAAGHGLKEASTDASTLEQHLEELKELTDRLKAALFQVKIMGAELPEGQTEEEESLSGPLIPQGLSEEEQGVAQILLEYLKGLGPAEEAPPAPQVPPAEEAPEAVPASMPADMPSDISSDIDEEATLPFGISPEAAEAGEEETLPGMAPGEDEGLEATVLLPGAGPIDINDAPSQGPGAGKAPEMPGAPPVPPSPSSAGAAATEEDIPETVILGPGSGPLSVPGDKAQGQPQGKQEKKEQMPPKTASSETAPPEDEDDFLAETVILTPDDLKPPGGGRKG